LLHPRDHMIAHTKALLEQLEATESEWVNVRTVLWPDTAHRDSPIPEIVEEARELDTVKLAYMGDGRFKNPFTMTVEVGKVPVVDQHKGNYPRIITGFYEGAQHRHPEVGNRFDADYQQQWFSTAKVLGLRVAGDKVYVATDALTLHEGGYLRYNKAKAVVVEDEA
jgi:hypothetical protein